MGQIGAGVFRRKMFRFAKKIGFDPEGSMFCAYSKDEEALADFILRFKKACEDKSLISDLFSRAELD